MGQDMIWVPGRQRSAYLKPEPAEEATRVVKVPKGVVDLDDPAFSSSTDSECRRIETRRCGGASAEFAWLWPYPRRANNVELKESIEQKQDVLGCWLYSAEGLRKRMRCPCCRQTKRRDRYMRGCSKEGEA